MICNLFCSGVGGCGVYFSGGVIICDVGFKFVGELFYYSG